MTSPRMPLTSMRSPCPNGERMTSTTHPTRLRSASRMAMASPAPTIVKRATTASGRGDQMRTRARRDRSAAERLTIFDVRYRRSGSSR